MRKKTVVVPALLVCSVAIASAIVSVAGSSPAGAYQRVVLVSWDGVRRDVLLDLLEVPDPGQPCWTDGLVFPVDTGRVDGTGAPVFTCLPALAGAKPADAPLESPAYDPFEVIASHTTNDGQTMTKPQHAAMLTGCDVTTTGVTTNVSTARVPPGFVIYERLMDAFDPVGGDGSRNGKIFRTQHSADKKFVGTALHYYAKRNRALQVATGHGNDSGANPGALKYAAKTFERWRTETLTLGLPEPSFFLFLHFKSTDWAGHLGGDGSKQYRQAIVETDRKLYTLMEMLRTYGWGDAGVLVTTDHGFRGNTHSRNAGRTVFNTWVAARSVHLDTSAIPLRTEADYCASHEDPAACLAGGPEIPMPPEDAVPNVMVSDLVPTILDMFGVDWSGTAITGRSLYRP